MNQKKIIIGIAGSIGAGKGTLTTYLTQQYHAGNVRYSAILQDILRRLDLGYTRKNLALLAESLRATFGGDVLSRALVGDVQRADTHVIVIDGIRKKAELDVLRDLDNFVFIFVDADLQLRYNRIHTRDEKADDATKTFEEFIADHERAADRDVPSLKEYADYNIDNTGTMEDMQQQVDNIISKLRHQV